MIFITPAAFGTAAKEWIEVAGAVVYAGATTYFLVKGRIERAAHVARTEARLEAIEQRQNRHGAIITGVKSVDTENN